MKNSIRVFLFCILFPALSFAQVSKNWVWVNGSSAYDQPAVTNGGTSNTPGARASATTWSDKNGQLWLFGGYKGGDLYNDLWVFSYATKTWRLVKGNIFPNAQTVAGPPNTQNASYLPGSRAGAGSCIDASGNLWLYGGYGNGVRNGAYSASGYLSDLWKYDVSRNNWVYISGNIGAGVGVFGFASGFGTTHTPGGRAYLTMWFDKTGMLWTFGGEFSATGTINVYADIWRYKPATDEWGRYLPRGFLPPSNANYLGNYPATHGTTTNAWPAARSKFVHWTDNNGNIWVFSGTGSLNFSPLLNDLWKFDTATKEWTWISGNNNTLYNYLEKFGVYTVKGVADAVGRPGYREDGLGFLDTDGNLLVYGGYGLSAYPTTPIPPGYQSDGALDDLWKFDISTGNWTWLAGNVGAGQPPVYTALNAFSTTSGPGGRTAASGSIDAQGDIWLFGGRDLAGYHNDTWTWSFATLLPASPIVLQATLQDGKVILNWKVDASTAYENLQLDRSANSTDFTALASYTEGAPSSFTDTAPFAGANYYRIKLRQAAGVTYSKTVVVRTMPAAVAQLRYYPNPAQRYLHVEGLAAVGYQGYTVFDNLGRALLVKETASKATTIDISVASLPSGWYLLQIKTDTGPLNYKFVKE